MLTFKALRLGTATKMVSCLSLGNLQNNPRVFAPNYYKENTKLEGENEVKSKNFDHEIIGDILFIWMKHFPGHSQQ